MSEHPRPLLLNSTLQGGGSAAATRRLLAGLRQIGTDAHLLVTGRAAGAEGVVELSRPIDRMLVKAAKGVELAVQNLYSLRAGESFTSAWLGARLHAAARRLRATVLHLNQPTNGFVSLRFFRGGGLPVVWTQHDWWAMTGGCHVPGSCPRHQVGCGACPLLGSSRERDLSRHNFQRKHRRLPRARPRLVSVSHALQADLQASTMWRGHAVAVIPNGLDLAVFSPSERLAAREQLGLPPTKNVLLFGASVAVPNKGFSDVRALAERLAASGTAGEYVLIQFGDPVDGPPLRLPIETRAFGYVRDDRLLVALYNAADVTLVPSRLESFGLVAAESLACGTPVLAYRTGGLTDVVDHASNGYLAAPFALDDFAHGLSQMLQSGIRAQLRTAARAKACARFDVRDVARAYVRLYEGGDG